MQHPFRMDVERRGERELFVSRRFAATPEQVFEAHVRPELIKRWLSVRLPLEICTVDLRPGGSFRYVWRFPDGREMGLSGEFLEVERPHKTVHTEIFDQDWTGGPATITTFFLPDPVGCRMEMSILYQSAEGRETALSTPMTEGMAEGYEALDGLFGG